MKAQEDMDVPIELPGCLTPFDIATGVQHVWLRC